MQILYVIISAVGWAFSMVTLGIVLKYDTHLYGEFESHDRWNERGNQ